jgi:hypothetical protein
MKPKALKKRLVLNKKTIADLSESKMVKVKGGNPTWVQSCYNTVCCPTTPYTDCCRTKIYPCTEGGPSICFCEETIICEDTNTC